MSNPKFGEPWLYEEIENVLAHAEAVPDPFKGSSMGCTCTPDEECNFHWRLSSLKLAIARIRAAMGGE